VLETALGEELTEHLGHPKHQADPDREATNVRNGSRPKTVISDAVGEVTIEVPRDREGTFAPQIVKKRQRRLTDVDEIVLSLYAKGLTTGEISAHFAEIYGASVSKETISRITDAVVAEMQDWAARPLDGVYVPATGPPAPALHDVVRRVEVRIDESAPLPGKTGIAEVTVHRVEEHFRRAGYNDSSEDHGNGRR
jgi:hypothetical protein